MRTVLCTIPSVQVDIAILCTRIDVAIPGIPSVRVDIAIHSEQVDIAILCSRIDIAIQSIPYMIHT